MQKLQLLRASFLDVLSNPKGTNFKVIAFNYGPMRIRDRVGGGTGD